MNVKISLQFALLIPFWFKSQGKLKEDTAVPLLSKEKWGWADLFSKKTLIEPVYDSVDYDPKIGFLVFKKNKIGFVDSKNANEYFVNFSKKITKEINFSKSISLDEPELPIPMKVKNDEILLKGNHDFNYGNKYKDENFKLGNVKLINSNRYFDDYLIVKNEEDNKFGIINYYKDSIILFPEYDDIRIIKRIYEYFVIAEKEKKLTLLFDGIKVSENQYDEIIYNETQDVMILKKDNLYGFVLFKNKITK